MMGLKFLILLSYTLAARNKLENVLLISETGTGIFTLGISGNFRRISETTVTVVNKEKESNCVIEEISDVYITCTVQTSAGVYQTKLGYKTRTGRNRTEFCDLLACRLPLYVDSEDAVF